MIVKTIFLGLLSAGAAGSVMYFGTLPDSGSDASASNDAAIIDVPKSSKVSDSATNTLSVETPKKDDETVKRLPSLRNAIEDKRMERGPKAEKKAEATQSETAQATEKPKKRWLDQYLKNQNKKAAAEEIIVEEVPIEPELSPEDETELELEAKNDSVALEIELYEEPIDSEQSKTSQSADMLNEIISADSDGPNATRYFKIEDGVLVEVKLAEVEEAQANDVDEERYERGPASRDRILSVAFEEAGRITKPELRDQAYFGILEYALRQENFVEAEQALAKIEQVDMSYTAKSRIAVAFAQKGLSSMAFKTINSVEEPELRDFMRLQVIEAMIAPERLPSQWRDEASN